MTEQEGRIAAFALLVKINVITGWSFPLSDKQQDVLVNQFAMLLIEKYPTVNSDEMEYAFRNFEAKDWGKDLNLNLIKEVMTPYLEKRYEASLVEQQIKEKPKELPGEKMTSEEIVQISKDLYLKTKLWGMISPRCYDILVKEGKINLSQEQKDKINAKVKTHFYSAENKDTLRELNHESRARAINQNAKRVAVAEYFNQC